MRDPGGLLRARADEFDRDGASLAAMIIREAADWLDAQLEDTPHQIFVNIWTTEGTTPDGTLIGFRTREEAQCAGADTGVRAVKLP